MYAVYLYLYITYNRCQVILLCDEKLSEVVYSFCDGAKCKQTKNYIVKALFIHECFVICC